MNKSKGFLDWNPDNVTISNVLEIKISTNDSFNELTVPNGKEIDGTMELGTNGSNSGNLFDDQNTIMPQVRIIQNIIVVVFRHDKFT